MMQWVLGRFRPIDERPIIQVLVFGAVMLALRLWLSMPFWSSGWTKWVDFPTQLSTSAKFLFANEFMLHLPGGPYPMPFPVAMAWLSGVGEIVLPVLLVAGFLTRPAALGILAMTLVIQLTIPTGWPLHVQWALAGLAIVVFGPGFFSIDRVVYGILQRSKQSGLAFSRKRS